LFDTSNQFLIYIRDVAVINIYCLCLGAFVAILSGLSGLGFLNGMGATNAPELKYEGRLNAIKSVNELFNGFINRFDETDCTALTGCDWSKKEDKNGTLKMKFTKTPVSVNLNMSLKNALTKRQWQINKEGNL
jgi:hypothetical protein